VLECNEITANDIALIETFSPVLSKFMVYLSKNKRSDAHLTCGMKLLGELLVVAKNTFTPRNNNFEENIFDYDDPYEFKCADDYFQELFTTGVFFPGRKIIRKIRPVNIQNESRCNKDSKKAGRLGAGTLLFWCAQHRYCLGFVILKSAESISQVAETFISRFQTQPKVIIYDNGCNLHEYILNRDPRIFKNTLILSDGFHWKNHTNCCLCYNSREYKFLDSTFVLTRDIIGFARTEEQNS
jgi:hypothetical protein